MKMTKKNKLLLLIILFTAVTITLCAIIIPQLNKPADRLSEAEIAQLREEYPVIPAPSHPTIDFIHPTLEQLIEDCVCLEDKNFYGNIVYGVVVDMVSDGSELSITYPSHKCTVQVKSCSGDLFEKGETVTVNLSQTFWSSEQLLSEGMSIVFPVFYEESAKYNYAAFFTGTYYVTEDGYVLSLYDENIFSEKQYSGLTVEDFMNELDSLIDQAQKKANRSA